MTHKALDSTLVDQPSEDALRASEARYRQIVEMAQEGIWTIDADNKTTFINPKMAGLLGFSVDEMMGASLFDFMDEEWKAIAILSLERRRHGITEELEFRFRRKDGTLIWTLVNANAMVNDAGAYVGALAMVSDITERRLAEAQVRLQSAALNAAGNAIVITDRAGAIAWVNPAFTLLTGYTADESIGRNPGELLKSGAQDDLFYKNLWDTIGAGNVWNHEITNRKKDGTVYVEEMTITPVKDADGEVTHFVAIKRDLTEEKRLEAQFLQAQKMESVGRLAGGIAHDFNNLLTVINGTAELASDLLKEGDPLTADLREILLAGQRAAVMTRQLLAFSRKQVLKMEILSLVTLVEGFRSMVQRLIGEDITLVVAPAKTEGRVRADAGQIEQLLMNLVVNARDAMPDGGTLAIDIQDVEMDEIAKSAGAPHGPYVLLKVSDTGTGMDEAARQRIFEPFFTTKPPGKGTGLGLATVYGVVKQSGGHVAVDSTPGRGTTFRIYLPRLEEAAQTTSTMRAAAATGAETILVVEDEDDVRHMATRMLTSAGFTVLPARSADEALRLIALREHQVHLMLTDMVMPTMSGPDLAARLATSRPEIKVLYTSGYADDAFLHRAVSEDVTHFIGKPYTKAELTRKIRETLDSPSNEQTP